MKEVELYGAAKARRQSGRRAARKGWKRVRERTWTRRSSVNGACAGGDRGVGRTLLLLLRSMIGGADAICSWIGKVMEL